MLETGLVDCVSLSFFISTDTSGLGTGLVRIIGRVVDQLCDAGSSRSLTSVACNCPTV